MRSILTLIAVALIGCAPAVAPVDTGVSSEPTGAPSGLLPHEMNAEQCQSAGGSMRPVCMRGTVQCVIRYSDAGRACRDGDDCQGSCRATMMNPPPGPVTGRCQETSDPCGCFANVEDGRVDAAMCVD